MMKSGARRIKIYKKYKKNKREIIKIVFRHIKRENKKSAIYATTTNSAQ